MREDQNAKLPISRKHADPPGTGRVARTRGPIRHRFMATEEGPKRYRLKHPTKPYVCFFYLLSLISPKQKQKRTLPSSFLLSGWGLERIVAAVVATPPWVVVEVARKRPVPTPLVSFFLVSFLVRRKPRSTNVKIDWKDRKKERRKRVESCEPLSLSFRRLSESERILNLWGFRRLRRRGVVSQKEASVSDASGVLSINDKGILSIMNGTKGIVWSSNTSRNSAEEPIAQLLDSGNFVVKDPNDSDSENFLWQSFDYPCDTFLPGMKIGINFVTGFDRHISSWKSMEDPVPGLYSMRIDPRGLPQLVVKKGPDITTRGGSWNGRYITGRQQPTVNPVYLYEFVWNKNEAYYKYEMRNSSIFSSTNESPPCKCLEGFMQGSASPGDLSSVDWSNGCTRRTPLTCDGGDSFLKQTGLKLPDTSKSWADISVDLKECEKLCLRNCSCTAYANLDIREGGHGCLLWFLDLIDITEFSKGGQDLYIRLATSDLEHIQSKGKLKEEQKAAIIAISVIITCGMMILALWLYVRKKKLRKTGEHGKEDLGLPGFDFAIIASATNNFSSNNILGKGGFGSVYKGTLIEGQEIAVKRLSKNSGQGLEEFKNEVTLISKLQHRNLVKLFGCCIRRDEKMLIYEYMPNESLDYFIFDQTRSKLLDWRIRMHIVDGIARGVLYLHHDSRLRIIHRDLKASNILLDNNMNPKISDFGLARKFGVDLTQAKTRRVVGTYGYMSPEYALDGIFSTKSDVFSFGVLVLEILSGKKNRDFPIRNMTIILLDMHGHCGLERGH
ncbi:hypothetical protein J1N35_004153 [Gossypium stocksii]|uniref:Receptor-like serine/threonine-protein kinase n=1 Tax=Gossypium stocksii TaxID=47602 RepID=A0A9D4AHR3_9ROSI|nr:hypothetical protein J1N35_004153 [Gossypium stocksii]